MLAVGDRIPHVEVWLAPRERVSMRELAAKGPILLLYYLFDCSSRIVGTTRPKVQ